MREALVIIIISTLLSSCNDGQPVKTHREGEPDIYYVQDEDREMNEAIKTANQTINSFDAALISQDTCYSYFSIKMRFETPKGGEHLWIDDISIENGNYIGIVGNVPESTTEIKLGEKIKIDKNKISDWMYIESGKLRGGYTMRLLRSKMTEAERKQFDSELGFIVEE